MLTYAPIFQIIHILYKKIQEFSMRNCYHTNNCNGMPAYSTQPEGTAPCGSSCTGGNSSPCGCNSSPYGGMGYCGPASRSNSNSCSSPASCGGSCTGGMGVPVSCTCYLAMATVPWQQFTNSYEPEQALRVGTMFPELDKPFLGRGVRA